VSCRAEVVIIGGGVTGASIAFHWSCVEVRGEQFLANLSGKESVGLARLRG
jgi:hypothetical protein